jgi:hypothetical protein
MGFSPSYDARASDTQPFPTILSAVSTLPSQTIQPDQQIQEQPENKELIKNTTKITQLTVEVKELKLLVLEQTKLIIQSLESKIDKESDAGD